MYKIREFLARFMNGRYGADELHKACAAIVLVLIIANWIVRSTVINIIIYILFIIMIFRCLSRNYYMRQRENRIFLNVRDAAARKARLLKSRWRDRKTHIYRKCPSCRAIIKLPKKRGRHICTCPKCRKDFSVRCY